MTGKSAKLEGVTQMLESGATPDEVAHLRRWKTVQIVQTYKHNSDEYKIMTDQKIPY